MRLVFASEIVLCLFAAFLFAQSADVVGPTGKIDPCPRQPKLNPEHYEPPPGMVLVPEGEYLMGDHHDGVSDALPVHAVYIDAFYINVCEVTNARYAAGLN